MIHFFDVGGYTRNLLKNNKKFNCYSYIFEPSNEFFKIIEKSLIINQTSL